MKNRTRIYLSILKGFKQEWKPVRRMTMALATQASFPDCGYYYSGIERSLLRAEDEVRRYVDAANKKWLHRLHIRLQHDLLRKAARASYEYYEVVRVVDKEGRAWTMYEMDSAMCGY